MKLYVEFLFGWIGVKQKVVEESLLDYGYYVLFFEYIDIEYVIEIFKYVVSLYLEFIVLFEGFYFVYEEIGNKMLVSVVLNQVIDVVKCNGFDELQRLLDMKQVIE